MGQVYDPVLKRLVSEAEADALNAERRATVVADGAANSFLGLRAPGDDRTQDVGFDVPTLPESERANIARVFPQLAGLIAQFTPAGRTMKGAMAVPSFIEMARQMLSGESLDPINAGIEGGKGALAHLIGSGIGAIGDKGEDMVTRALSLRGALKNDQAVRELPKLAIKEGAEMTEDGIAALRARATQTMPNGVKVTDKKMSALADAMRDARLDHATAPNRFTFWPNEMAANFFRQAPRELSMGRRMANPFGGVGTREHIAPGVEAALRAKMIQLKANDEPPMQTSRGPVRRRLK